MGQALKIGFIGGGGWLAQTLIRALLNRHVYEAGEIGVSYRRIAPQGIAVGLKTADSRELVERCETVVISVRPADFSSLAIDAGGKLVISVMAGIPLDMIAQHMRSERIVRALPNVAASVGHSYTPWTGTDAVTDADRAVVKRIFEACGTSDEMGSELQLDYLTGLTGSGPAFAALLADSLERDAIRMGLAPVVARRAVMQLLIGAGRLFEADPKPPAEIIKEFVDYGGVIAAAITTMQRSGFDAAVAEGLAAALEKTQSLSEASINRN